MNQASYACRIALCTITRHGYDSIKLRARGRLESTACASTANLVEVVSAAVVAKARLATGAIVFCVARRSLGKQQLQHSGSVCISRGMQRNACNSWNSSTCNRLVAGRQVVNQHENHLKTLESSRGLVDHSSPREQKHLIVKPKMRKLQEDRAAEIQLENRILLQKMLSIDTKPCSVSREVLQNQRIPPRSLNAEAQRRELDRISSDNSELLKRLQGAKATNDLRAMEEEEVDRQALKFRLQQNSGRGRALKLRMPARTSPAASARLPRIKNDPFGRTDDWSGLSNAELDARLQVLERGRRGSQGQPALEDQ